MALGTWRERLGRLPALLREHVWVILIAAVLAANALVVYRLFFAPPPQRLAPSLPSPAPSPGPPAGAVASALTGAYIPEADAAVRPVAVMVDNFVTARPTSGLPSAAVVWETLVEGGVTRFLAVLQTSREVTVGPVRSARDYFLPWAKEVDAIYAHSGGSAPALAAIARDGTLDDANEFRNGRAYFRVPGAAAPHNLYTTTARLRELAAAKGWRVQPEVSAWPVSDAPLAEEGSQAAARLTINFSPIPAYRVQWRYDVERGVYLRAQGGVVASDRETREQLAARNVIVQFAEVAPAPAVAPDAVAVGTVGRGDAWFFRDGRVAKGRWEKPDAAARTVFSGPMGEPYALARGTAWIEVVPAGRAGAVAVE
jgi:hypothetical protein